MFTKPNAAHVIGLSLEGTTLKAAELSYKSGKPVLDKLYNIEEEFQPTGELVNPLYKDGQGKILKDHLQNSLIVTALNSNEVLVRSLDIKLKKESDVDAVLAFQAEPLLPYPVENAILDRIILGKNQESTQLTLIAARKDHIQEHLAQWNGFQIEPEVVSCIPISLTGFSKQFTQSNSPHIVIDLGKRQITCVLVNKNKLIASQSLPSGINVLFQAFERDSSQEISWDQFSKFDFNNLSKQDNPLLLAAIENLRLELTRVIYALSKQHKEEEVREILLTGDGATLTFLDQILFQSMQKTILEIKENSKFPVTINELKRFAIPIGSALTALPNGSADQVNFLQQEFVYSKPWKRLTKPLGLYFAACCLLALAIYIFGESYVGSKENQLRQEYVNLLGILNKPYESFEKEYTSKHPLESQITEGIIPIGDLSQENISNRLATLQKEMKDSPDSFPLMPNTPRVSDVLAWLSTHPDVTNKDKPSSSPLQIDSFSYTMVKRPEQKKPHEKYQVKVELEFSSPTPKLAREFHDALIAPNNLVDPKGEVKWSSNRGKFRTSFFLKDKTVYPSSIPDSGV